MRILTVLLLPASPASAASLTEDFSSYAKNVCIADGSSFGPWASAFSGYGCVKIAGDGTSSWLDEAPAERLALGDARLARAGASFSAR